MHTILYLKTVSYTIKNWFSFALIQTIYYMGLMLFTTGFESDLYCHEYLILWKDKNIKWQNRHFYIWDIN